MGIPQRNKCGETAGVVPEVCPRQTHSNSLQPTQINLKAIFDCFQDTSRFSIGQPHCTVRGNSMVGKQRYPQLLEEVKRLVPTD